MAPSSRRTSDRSTKRSIDLSEMIARHMGIEREVVEQRSLFDLSVPSSTQSLPLDRTKSVNRRLLNPGVFQQNPP